MSRPSLAVVVLVLALSAVAVAGAVSVGTVNSTVPVVGSGSGEPNHLSINASEVASSNTTTVNLDVGSAISADSSSLQATYLSLKFERALANATSDANRTREVDATLDRLRNATRALEARSRANGEAFANGSNDATVFLRERARIQVRADRLQGSIAEIQGNISQDTLQARFDGINARLEALQGPISSKSVGYLTGDVTPQSIYVEVSDSGYTLADITDRQYSRETFLADERRPNAPNQFESGSTEWSTAVQNRVVEVYPWGGQNRRGGSIFPVGAATYRVTRTLETGELTLYLDGGTTNVFREYQTRSVESFNTTTAINRTNGSVQLTVNRSYVTGPAEITLHDATSNSTVNGTVTVGDREPVRVGADGTLWIVEPRDGVRINATAGTAEFSTTLSGS